MIEFAANHCSEKAHRLGYEGWAEEAKRDMIVLTGGLGGVMEAACKGGKDSHGITVGIIPPEKNRYARPYYNIVVAAGVGWVGILLLPTVRTP